MENERAHERKESENVYRMKKERVREKGTSEVR